MSKRSATARCLLLLTVVVTVLALVGEAGAQPRPSGTTAHTRDHAAHHHAARHRRAHHRRRKKLHAQPARDHAPTLAAKPTSVAETSTVQTPAASGGQASAVASQVAGAVPTAGSGVERFYVYPQDSAVIEEHALLAQGDQSDAAQIEKIASQPEGIWLTSDGSASVVPRIMSDAASGGTVPVFVVYNIPDRDCGGYSSGGASGAADYEGFINSIVAGLGQGKAVVIVEPDALTNLAAGCSSMASDGPLLTYAVQHLDNDANAAVYVDAGNPGWEPAAAEASKLQQLLGSTRAGFAVNVSNFVSTAKDITYGTAISQASGGRHFVIDTSRNGGSVASGAWCNPAGAAIGVDPTTATGNPLVDAFLWIKDVGNSDGTCNGGPAAGQFWLSYALSLAANG